MSALACGMEKVLWQSYLKNRFSNWAFDVPIADADIESLKSLHTLFGKYLNHMLVNFEQNHMVQTIQNFKLFDQNVVAILEDAPVTETIV